MKLVIRSERALSLHDLRKKYKNFLGENASFRTNILFVYFPTSKKET